MCREAAREGMFATRYVRPLAGDHPDEHVLTALWSNALSSARKDEVKRHVAACSRCRALLERLVRATPAETSPSHVGDWSLDETKVWAAASTIPRRATLLVRQGEPSEESQAFVVSIAESLRLVEPKRQPSPDAPVLGDGKLKFRFKPYRDGTAMCLAVAYARLQPLMETTAAGVSLTPASGPPQQAEIRPGVEAVFELVPGTSRLVIEVRPRWEIEIRFDA